MPRSVSRFGGLLTNYLEQKHRSDGDIERLSHQKFAFWFQAKRLPQRPRPLGFPKTPKVSAVSTRIVTHLSRRDVANWRNEVSLPRKWQSVVMLAVLLDLDERATDELLTQAHHPPLAELRKRASAPEDAQLLAQWTPRTPPPFQAIAPTKKFVGRVKELKHLERELLDGHTITITSVRGMGGVGKTSIAAMLAERLRENFPDGVLWGALERSDTMSILALFAGAYQADVSGYHDVATRAAAVRDLLKDKRVLMILDNAVTSEQVFDLLPSGEAQAAVLITTRNELAVSDDALRFRLTPFDKRGAEAFALFKKYLGKHAGRQRAGLDEIARLLGHLPLALAIAGGHIASVKEEKTLAFAVEQFLQRVRDEKKRLGALDREILSVRASLAISYDALPAELQNFFVALGAFGGNDFDAAAAAFVAQVSEENASAHLNALEKLSLAQETQAGRFTLHELVRDFAREKLVGADAYARMCEYYFQLVEPHNDLHEFSAIVGEDSNIQAALRTAREGQASALLARGALICGDYLLSNGRFAFYDEILEATERGLPPAAKSERMRIYLKRGELARLWGSPTRARAFFETGLPLVYELEEGPQIAEYLNNLGIAAYLDGSYADAERYFRQTLEIAQAINYQRILSGLYNSLALLYQVQGDFDTALEFLDRATEHFGHSWQVAITTNLILRGRIATCRGEFAQAETCFLDALQDGEQKGVSVRRVGVYEGLGRVALARGDWAGAEDYFQKLVRSANEMEHRSWQAVAYAWLGETAWRRGDVAQGGAHLQHALGTVQESDDHTRNATVLLACLRFNVAQQRWEHARQLVQEIESRRVNYVEARANLLFAKAHIAAAEGNSDAARQCARDALALYDKMKHYRAAEVRAWLAEMTRNILDGKILVPTESIKPMIRET